MAYSSLATSSLLFSHIIPPILAFIGIIAITTGIIDKKNQYTLLGFGLFFIAVISPFLIIPVLLSGG